MHEQYFGLEYMATFRPTFWNMLKLRLFGKKVTQRAGRIEVVWYVYKDKIYLTKCSA